MMRSETLMRAWWTVLWGGLVLLVTVAAGQEPSRTTRS